MTKSRKSAYIRLLLLFAVLATLSTIWFRIESPSDSLVQTMASTVSVKFTSTGTKIPTITIVPETNTPTALRTPTRTKTSTPTASPTYTPLPKLDATQVEATIKQFLSKNAVCQSPCIWGIIPGTTSLGKAKNIFGQLRSPLAQANLLGKDYYESTMSLRDGLSIGLILRVQDDSILNLQLRIGLTNYNGWSVWQDWSSSKPIGILQEYGTPTKVQFFLSYPTEPGFPSGTAWYDMTMFYNDKNLIVQYNNARVIDDNFIRVCPERDRFDGIGIWLGKELEYIPPEGTSLEKATTLTIEQFFELITRDGESACFFLDSNAFR